LCPREALGSVELWEKMPRKLGMASGMLEANQLPVMGTWTFMPVKCGTALDARCNVPKALANIKISITLLQVVSS